MNISILIFHILLVGGITLIAFRFGKEILISWISLLAVTSNLFILKEINLFGLNATCTDSLAVGYLLGVNLIQEFFGKKEAKKTIWIAFFTAIAFLILSCFHMAYIPDHVDDSHDHYRFILYPIPRVIFASLLSFFLVQFFDLSFFSFLRKKTAGKYFPFRAFISAFFCEVLDTILFSYLALYGIHSDIKELILVSFGIKAITLIIATPFFIFSKKIGQHLGVSHESI